MKPPTQVAAAAANISPQGSLHCRCEATGPLPIGSANVLVMNKELVEIRQSADPGDAEQPDGRPGPDPRDEPREVLALSRSDPAPLSEPFEWASRTMQGPATRSRSRNTMWAARSRAAQPSNRVGTSGPSSSRRSQSSRRSCVSNPTSAMPRQSTRNSRHVERGRRSTATEGATMVRDLDGHLSTGTLCSEQSQSGLPEAAVEQAGSPRLSDVSDPGDHDLAGRGGRSAVASTAAA